MSSLSSGSPFFQSQEVMSRSSFDPPPWNCVPPSAPISGKTPLKSSECAPVLAPPAYRAAQSSGTPEVLIRLPHPVALRDSSAGPPSFSWAGWGSASRHRPRSASPQWIEASDVGRCQDSECPPDVENRSSGVTGIGAEVPVQSENRAQSGDEFTRNCCQ